MQLRIPTTEKMVSQILLAKGPWKNKLTIQFLFLGFSTENEAPVISNHVKALTSSAAWNAQISVIEEVLDFELERTRGYESFAVGMQEVTYLEAALGGNLYSC